MHKLGKNVYNKLLSSEAHLFLGNNHKYQKEIKKEGKA